jgi:hypothetical protein
MLLVRQPLRVIRQFTFLTMLVVAAGGCDSTNPTLAIRAEVSPSAIVAGGSDTTTIRVTVVNLTAVPVDRVVGCDNLFSVEDLSGREVVSSYRVTCPVENSVPLRIELGAFESVELTRLWTGVNVVYSGGYVTEPLPAGAYLIYGRLGELRSAPQGVDLVAP